MDKSLWGCCVGYSAKPHGGLRANGRTRAPLGYFPLNSRINSEFSRAALFERDFGPNLFLDALGNILSSFFSENQFLFNDTLNINHFCYPE